MLIVGIRGVGGGHTWRRRAREKRGKKKRQGR
jgi:hypothetical protein